MSKTTRKGNGRERSENIERYFIRPLVGSESGTPTLQSHLQTVGQGEQKLLQTLRCRSEESADCQEGRRSSLDIHYKVDDVPPAYLCVLLGFQQVLMTITGTMSLPILLAGKLCAVDQGTVSARLMSITFFMCGLATLLQTTIGIRLPIIQGGSHTFIPPVIAMMSLDRWRCPDVHGNHTEDVWMSRMREIQGNLMLASLAQVVLGCTGLMGILLRFIGPMTIAPTIALIGLSLTGVVSQFSHVNWPIAITTMGLMLTFSLIPGKRHQLIPCFSRRQGCHLKHFPILQLFSVVFAFTIAWLLCHVLTVTDIFPNNTNSTSYLARTDVRLHVLYDAPWFTIPYPFQFGMPTLSAAGFLGMLAATLASIIESIGDYFAAARISGSPAPSSSAINRGIATEGLASIFSGMLGAGHATTSYSGNIGAIVVTKVASRRVFQTAGLILLVCGVLGKFGAVLALVPDPVVGGILGVALGTVASVGVTTSMYADMKSSRNVAIFGISLMVGLALPQWVTANLQTIDTGNRDLDQVLVVLLGTPMTVGGLLGLLLDNIIPGTPEERGLMTWRQDGLKQNSEQDSSFLKVYDIPYISDLLKDIPLCSYFPLSPSYFPLSPSYFPLSPSYLPRTCSCCHKKEDRERQENSLAFEVEVIPNGNAIDKQNS